MKSWIVLLCLMALAGFVCSCNRTAQSAPERPSKATQGAVASAAAQPQAKEKKGEAASTNVRVWPVELGDLQETIALRGSILPNKSVTFSAETSGRVESLALDLGDRVKKGATLARIDYTTLRAQRDQAKAGYDLAAKTAERIKALRAEDLVSQQQLDEAETQRVSARASLRVMEAQMSKSAVRSTLDGIVARKFVERGEYVNPGQPMLQVVDFSTVEVTAQVPEKEVSRVKRDMAVTVTIDALGRDFEGKVHVVIPAADPTSRTFELRVRVPNEDYAILVGMAASLSITAKVHEEVVVVSQDVVVESTQGRAVFVEQDGVARKRNVVLGPVQGDRVMVLEGLAKGERLVVEGHRDLYDGVRVKVVSGPGERS